MLLTVGLMGACSNSEEYGAKNSDDFIVLNPFDEGDSFAAISDFFRTEFGTSEDEKPFDLKNNVSSEDDPCIIINSEEDFMEAYMGKLNLPTIDFSLYTLIIGKAYLSAGTFIDNMGIRQTNPEKATLAINCIVDTKGAYTCNELWEYYWKLFPKFHASEINVEVNREFGIVENNKKQYE
jgi:hypothetical protein